jgi:tryptophan synthase beta chain
MPEILVAPLEQLEAVYREAKDDPAFHTEWAQLNRDFSGRPTALDCCKRLSEQLGGAEIWLKREDLPRVYSALRTT